MRRRAWRSAAAREAGDLTVDSLALSSAAPPTSENGAPAAHDPQEYQWAYGHPRGPPSGSPNSAPPYDFLIVAAVFLRRRLSVLLAACSQHLHSFHPPLLFSPLCHTGAAPRAPPSPAPPYVGPTRHATPPRPFALPAPGSHTRV
jgi:hypothetical protein